MSWHITMTPFAVGADSVVYANIAHSEGEVLVAKIVEYALETPRVLFLGVALSKRLLRLLDHAGAKAIATVLGSRLHSKRRARSSSRSAR